MKPVITRRIYKILKKENPNISEEQFIICEPLYLESFNICIPEIKLKSYIDVIPETKSMPLTKETIERLTKND